MSTDSKPVLKVMPLGGLGEIGMNCLLLECGDDIVMIDCGVQFPDTNSPGVEFLCPDFEYIWERREKFKGLVITHGHDDHIGATPYICEHMDVDIHCTPFVQGLITHKLKEKGRLGKVSFHEIKPREKFTVGCFTFDGIPVQHSIIEALGFVIQTPVGPIVHSGDFKHDHKAFRDATTDLQPFREYGDKGIRLLLCDSTNADKPGMTISEYDVIESIDRELAAQKGRTFIGMFSSNIRRVEGIMGVVAKQKKKLALVGRGLHHYTSNAHKVGGLQIPDDTLILAEKMDKYPDDQLVILVTGAQGEPQSAMVRILDGNHPEVKFKRGDSVIFSSRFIPGNERQISLMMNDMCRQGVNVIYEGHKKVHVSGHGFQEDLLELHRACRADFFVPVHGEYRHMVKHAEMAYQNGMEYKKAYVIQNGDVIEVTEDEMKVTAKLDIKRVPIVTGIPMICDDEVFKQRRGMAKAGVVFCIVRKKGNDFDLPTIVPHGILYRQGVEPEDVVPKAQKELLKNLYTAAPGADLAEEARLTLRRFFKRVASYKPIVIAKSFGA